MLFATFLKGVLYIDQLEPKEVNFCFYCQMYLATLLCTQSNCNIEIIETKVTLLFHTECPKILLPFYWSLLSPMFFESSCSQSLNILTIYRQIVLCLPIFFMLLHTIRCATKVGYCYQLQLSCSFVNLTIFLST